MGDVSINGWPVIEAWSSPALKSGDIPGVKDRRLTMDADVLPLFLNFCKWYNRNIYKINKRGEKLDDWSYSTPRMGNAAPNSYSDHSSGTAIDLNATTVGAQGPARRKWWTKRSKRVRSLGRVRHKMIQKKLKHYQVLMWGGASDLGGSYTKPENWDWMHFAIKPGVSREQVRKRIKELGIGPDGRKIKK